ncbi:amino acid ABC transporter substrate-binding protein (PAAT family) [Brevibacterium sanguinis]|uniref:Amino acid ABC transporter substrate-binding protein (PAAT family) n=2 Tax=Brevibacterium TaxID=1696 RepID=A0A366IR00_9MICO|nr:MULTISPECIES: ABC transporter substrate-binding protein [Brevibacterium]RBP67877.1 amino acid ABC transporter substrate-binding protein (PAAT family) [Brevibacterium sanguinis]RBP74706.1 amino acid ABC transporter substrate-binding protein (PAAT family) [Brevibacterium celere]
MRTSTTMIAVVAVSALFLSACSSGSADASGDAGSAFGECEVTGEAGSITLDPVADGTLTVATNLPSPAWWKGISPEEITGGYEYCMAATIAHRAGLESVTVKNVSFDGLVAGQVKDFDIALAQVSITEERDKVVDFSEPYYSSKIGVLTQADSGVTPENIADRQLGVQVGTTAVDFVPETVAPKQEARTFQDTEGMITAVQSGQIDAALQDTAIVLGFAQQSGGALEVVGQYDSGEEYGAIYPQGAANSGELDKAISAMHDDGTFDALSAAWLAEAFGTDPNTIPEF